MNTGQGRVHFCFSCCFHLPEQMSFYAFVDQLELDLCYLQQREASNGNNCEQGMPMPEYEIGCVEGNP